MGNHQSTTSTSSSAAGGGGHSSHGHSTPSSSARSRASTLASKIGSSHHHASPNNNAVGLSDQIVDGGSLEPLSYTYATSMVDYSRPTVHKLIQDRKLAPFYLGLQDFEEDWDTAEVVSALVDADEHATRNLKDALVQANQTVQDAESAASSSSTTQGTSRKSKEAALLLSQAQLHRERLNEVIKHRDKKGGTGIAGYSREEQAKLYENRAIECPICFLYYPPPLVHTRCCDQPICTECFVQIKRAEPDATHLESEPAACPYCMEPNFGCVYNRESHRPSIQPQASGSSSAVSSSEDSVQQAEKKPRRKSFAHTEKEVVTTDQLHPDWQAKVEAMKATVARRANRRIVFRQVGDRLIPVGVTSGRSQDGANATISTAQLPPGFITQVAAAIDANNSSSGRSRSGRRRNQEIAAYLQSMGIEVGQDLEEMMVEEAMRLSMQEEEERRKKEQQQQQQQESSRASLDTPRTSMDTSRPMASTSAVTQDLMSEAIDAPMSSLSLQSPVTPSLAPTASTSTGGSPAVPSGPPRLPSINVGSTNLAPAVLSPATSANANPIATTGHQPPQPQSPPPAPRMEGSAPLVPTASSASVASSAFSTVTDPMASGAGYEQLADDDDDEEEATGSSRR